MVAIGWTWSLGFSAAALEGAPGRALHLAALLGPMLAWVGVLLSPVGPTRRTAFLGRVLDVRLVAPRWWAAVIGLGLGLPGMAAVLAAFMGHETALEPSLTAGGVFAIVGFALGAGLVEEPGWRGIAQDGLQPVAGRLRSAAVLGVLWSLWHLPLYFIDGTYQHNLGVGTVEFWLSMTIRVPLAVLLVWLVSSTGGAIVAAIVAHALGNTVGELLATGRTATVLELALTTLAAAAVAVVWARERRRVPAPAHMPCDGGSSREGIAPGGSGLDAPQ
jgi:uncharacterized protein